MIFVKFTLVLKGIANMFGTKETMFQWARQDRMIQYSRKVQENEILVGEKGAEGDLKNVAFTPLDSQTTTRMQQLLS